jgi:hypothetical protein
MLTAVRQGAEFGEAEEAAVALDRVHRAKNARQPLGIVGAFLQRDQIAVELIEVLARFDEKLLDEFAVVVHPRPSWRWCVRAKPGHGAAKAAVSANPAFEAYTRKPAPGGWHRPCTTLCCDGCAGCSTPSTPPSKPAAQARENAIHHPELRPGFPRLRVGLGWERQHQPDCARGLDQAAWIAGMIVEVPVQAPVMAYWQP